MPHTEQQRLARCGWTDGPRWTVQIIRWDDEPLHLLLLDDAVELKVYKQWQESWCIICARCDNSLTTVLC